MLFILFWALKILFTWLSMAMGQSQTSRFHLKYLKLFSEDDNIVILAWKNSFSEALLWEGLLGHAKNKY